MFYKREKNKTRKRKNIQILTDSFFAHFKNFTSKITANGRSRLGKTKMNMFPVCRILRSMGYFDQKILGSVFGKLNKYETNHSALIQ
jgi:hypothetical protein